MINALEVSIALASSSTFQTLANHADALTSSIPQLAGQQADVAKVLEMVRDAGLPLYVGYHLDSSPILSGRFDVF